MTIPEVLIRPLADGEPAPDPLVLLADPAPDLVAAYLRRVCASSHPWRKASWRFMSYGPMPSSGGVSAHLADLSSRPSPVADWFTRLFLGDTSTQVKTTLDLIGWLVPLL